MFDTLIELLARQACVIIPRLGGFVVNDCVAKSENGQFFPPRKELVFNPKLIHNDGDLAQAMMRKRGCSFDEANRSIEQTVDAVWSSLKNDGIYVAPGFGLFTMKSGKVAFQQKDLKVEFHDTFGLDSFYFPTLDKKLLKKYAVASSSDANGSVKSFLVGAAAVLAFLLIGQPVKDSSRSDMASLAPMMVSQNSLAHELEVQKNELDQLKSELVSYRDAEVDYYLIAADFDNEEAANRYVERANDASLSLICIKQRYYVTIFSAKSKEEVSAFCDSLPAISEKAYMLSVSKFNEDLTNGKDIR